MRRVAFGLSIALSIASAPRRADADLAPPSVESCRRLPEGARCFVRGLVPGHCVHERDTSVRGSDEPWVADVRCRVDGPGDAASASPSSSSAPSPSAPTTAASSRPAPSSSCAVAPTPIDDPEGRISTSAIVLLATLLVARARRPSSSAPRVPRAMDR